MPNWSESMQQTYEYYIVDPGTWQDQEQLTNIKTSSITRDSSLETLGSASIDVTETVGECYIRIYLITIQNGIREKHPLATVLVQTPSSEHDGRTQNVSMDAYTPLLELKENLPDIGYYLEKNSNIMDQAYDIVSDNIRAPVVKTSCDEILNFDFVADPSESWLTFVHDLIQNAKYTFDIDPMGYIMFAPIQDTASLQPVFTYKDDATSILYPEITMNHDLYGIPNVVEVIYSNSEINYSATVVNDDPNSPLSTVNRGRRITQRVTNPDIIGNPSEESIQAYAEQLLRELSVMEYTISYQHAYCPVRVGDCVLINSIRYQLNNIKAKVISQTIDCTPGCPVQETAVYTVKLWR